MYFVGIDWADLHHDVAVLNEKGRELKLLAKAILILSSLGGTGEVRPF